MAYSDFTLAKVKSSFDFMFDESRNLFRETLGVQPSKLLESVLEENVALATAINSEKARSEFLIAPVLSEVRRQLNYQIALFSGSEFNVDPAQGLVGFCDFLLSASPEQYFITAPAITVVEAKNENIIAGLGQCVATMVAAKLFNQRAENDIETIHGVVTSGTIWKFLALEQNTVFIDLVEYHINQTDKILAILLQPFTGTRTKNLVQV